MTSDNFPEPKKDSTSNDDDRETTVGTHTGTQTLESGDMAFSGRNYCSNCGKRPPKTPIHCYVNSQGESIVRCKSNDCECLCRTHYSCKICTRLHPYGSKCNLPKLEKTSNPSSDAIFNKIISDWRELEEPQQELTKVKS